MINKVEISLVYFEVNRFHLFVLGDIYKKVP